MLKHYSICHNCDDTKATCELKACCSHLVPLCDQCAISDRAVINHSKCRACKGELSPEEDRAMVEAYERSQDGSDDYFEDDATMFDDMWLEDRQAERDRLEDDLDPDPR